MKKLTCILLAAALITLLFSAAAGEHTHLSNGIVGLDVNTLWENCDCGERLPVCTHQWVEDICTNCGAELYRYEEGDVELTLWDDHGNMIRQMSYSPDGELLMDHRWDYAYDEKGEMLSQTMYINAILTLESKYGYRLDGTHQETECKIYDVDGSWVSSTWNEFGLPEGIVHYSVDGVLLGEEKYEYTLDEDGFPKTGNYYVNGELLCEYEYFSGMEEGSLQIRETSATYHYEDGSVEKNTFNERGDVTSYLHMDETGEVVTEETMEYSYDESGEPQFYKVYQSGKLYKECTYAKGSGDWSYLFTETLYSEDGSYCLSQYDEVGDTLRETEYAADGTVLVDRTFEYVYEDNLFWYNEQRVFENGVLVICRKYAPDEDGFYYLKTEERYAEDGSVSTCEYTPDGALAEP